MNQEANLNSEHSFIENDKVTKLEVILAEITQSLGSELDSDIQEILGTLIQILNNTPSDKIDSQIANSKIVLSCTLSEGKNIELARHTIRSMKRVSGIPGPYSPPLIIILGLISLIYIAVPLGLWFGSDLEQDGVILGVSTSLLTFVGISGAIGGTVSIVSRLQQFNNIEKSYFSTLFFFGFFKPLVGAAFAMFVLSVIKAEILPLSVDTNVETYFFIALGFVSGFSERFAKDIAVHTESTVPTHIHNTKHE